MNNSFFAQPTDQYSWQLTIDRKTSNKHLIIGFNPTRTNNRATSTKPELWQLLHNHEPNISLIIIQKQIFTNEELSQIDAFIDLIHNFDDQILPNDFKLPQPRIAILTNTPYQTTNSILNPTTIVLYPYQTSLDKVKKDHISLTELENQCNNWFYGVS